MNKVKSFLRSIFDLAVNRKLIFELSKKDFKVKYAGSYLGIIWGFVQPIVTILVLWFVFQVGFRNSPIQDFPFILWLLCGMIPWFFISESITSAANSLIEYSYLVKKVVFKVSSLPLIKIVSALYVHLFFIAFLFFMFILYGYGFSIYNIQIIYYLFASIVLVTGISLITSSLMPFLKDMGQIVAIVLQLLFWMTPIFWNIKQVPDKYLNLLRMNLIFYIVQGYRDTFIDHVWFWQRWKIASYFWIMVIIILIFGIKLFKRLKPHFADVL